MQERPYCRCDGLSDADVEEMTTDIVLIFCSHLNRAARKLNLSSDSSYRFERGVDWCHLRIPACRQPHPRSRWWDCRW